MKNITKFLLCLLLGTLANAQDAGPQIEDAQDAKIPAKESRGISPAIAIEVLVDQLFQGGIEPIERWKQISKVNERYVAVQNTLSKLITEHAAKPGAKISWMSQLHSAIKLAGFWRIKEAEDALIARISTRLDPKTIPTGMMLSSEDFYPAALALERMGVRSSVVLRAIAKHDESDLPLLVWLLAKTQKRENAVILLKHYSEDDYYQATRMKKALQMLESVERVSGLLTQLPQLKN